MYKKAKQFYLSRLAYPLDEDLTRDCPLTHDGAIKAMADFHEKIDQSEFDLNIMMLKTMKLSMSALSLSLEAKQYDTAKEIIDNLEKATDEALTDLDKMKFIEDYLKPIKQ